MDQDGNVLDILVQRRRNKQAAKKFFRKLLKGLAYVPRVVITDKLKSYGAAKREILPGVAHRQHRYLNNRAENSPQPTRQRERPMQRFKSPVAMLNVSSLRMVPSRSASAHTDIGYPRLPTVKKWEKDARSGRRSRPQLWLHKIRACVSVLPFSG